MGLFARREKLKIIPSGSFSRLRFQVYSYLLQGVLPSITRQRDSKEKESAKLSTQKEKRDVFSESFSLHLLNLIQFTFHRWCFISYFSWEATCKEKNVSPEISSGLFSRVNYTFEQCLNQSPVYWNEMEDNGYPERNEIVNFSHFSDRSY